MAWYTRLFKAIEEFAEHARKKLIWYIWTLVVGGSISVSIPYYFSHLEEQANLDKSIQQYNTHLEDNGRLCSLHGEVKAQNLATIRLYKQFLSMVTDIYDSGWSDRYKHQIEEINKQAVDDKKTVELLIAKVKGTQLRVNVFDEDLRTYEYELATSVNMLEVIEGFCSAYLMGNDEGVIQKYEQVASKATALRSEFVHSTARLESMKLRQETTLQSTLIERKRLVSQSKIQFYKKYALWPAFALTVLYILTILNGIRTSWEGAGSLAPRQRRVAKRPKKRRK